MKKEFWHLVALVAVIVAICFVGRYDYNDEILYHMSEGSMKFCAKSWAMFLQLNWWMCICPIVSIGILWDV